MQLSPLLTPAGSDSQVQFNNEGILGGDSTLTFEKTTKTLSVDRIDAAKDIKLEEIETPETPSENQVRFYARDDGEGTSRLFMLDAEGLETDLTGGGGGATILDALYDVALGLTPYTDGKVLRANGSEYVDAVLAHGDLSDVGTNTHAQIDTHLASTANPHSVTAAQAGAVGLTGNEIIAGVKTFSSFPLLPSAVPTTARQAVPKDYVDAFAQSLEVKLACRAATTAAGTLAEDFEDGDVIDGVTLAEGDRILIKDQADATENGIYVVQAAGAPTRASDYDISDEVQEGTYTFITEGTANVGFQFVQITIDPVLGTDDLIFTYLTKPGAYTGSLGVEIVGADVRADLLATGAIGLTGNELKVNVDNASIEIATNALQVKAAGVTNAMLAGSIADTKLDTISTADKVNWAAVNKTGSVLDDIADVNAPNPSDDQALAWDAATSKWMAQTLGGGGGGSVNAAVSDVDLYSSGVSDASWKMNADTEELFGSTSSRIKLDLTYATHYRIVVNQTVAGYSGADLNLQYSTNNIDYQAADAPAAGELDVGDGVGVKVGAWADLVAGAQGDVWLRLVGKEGNGKATARWRQIRIQFKMLAAGGTLHDAVTVTDSDSIDLTLDDQDIQADVKEAYLDAIYQRKDAAHSLQFHGDLAGAWDTDAEWKLLDMDRGSSVFPNGIVITSWYVDCSVADPTTELNANLCYCDALANGAFPGDNPVLVDVLDTTTGNSSETDMSNSDLGSGIIPTGKILYLQMDADPVDANVVWSLVINYYMPGS